MLQIHNKAFPNNPQKFRVDSDDNNFKLIGPKLSVFKNAHHKSYNPPKLATLPVFSR